MNGPFPTEQNNSTGESLGKIGHEFGVVLAEKEGVAGLMQLWSSTQLNYPA